MRQHEEPPFWNRSLGEKSGTSVSSSHTTEVSVWFTSAPTSLNIFVFAFWQNSKSSPWMCFLRLCVPKTANNCLRCHSIYEGNGAVTIIARASKFLSPSPSVCVCVRTCVCMWNYAGPVCASNTGCQRKQICLTAMLLESTFYPDIFRS